MNDIFIIELPANLSEGEVESLESEIKNLEGVVDAGLDDVRSVDLATIGIWIKLVGDTLGVVSVGVPVVQQIRELIRKKGIKGVKINYADGTSITIDEISVKDFEKLAHLAPPQKKNTKKK